MQLDEKNTAAIARWILVWTTIGCVFAIQLHWYYELSWPLAIFWGIADWYLWGLLSLALGKAVRQLKNRHVRVRTRVALYLLSAPVVVAVHVILTILIGGIGSRPMDMSWLEYFQTIYAKKLTLNLLTYAAIVAIYERLSDSKPVQTAPFLAKLGDATRLVIADEIIHGEVCGNYVNLHTEDGVWPVRDTLTNLLRRLPDGHFVRISRSGMVSLKWVSEQISTAGTLKLVLGNGAEVRVARRHQPTVRRVLRTFYLNSAREDSKNIK